MGVLCAEIPSASPAQAIFNSIRLADITVGSMMFQDKPSVHTGVLSRFSQLPPIKGLVSDLSLSVARQLPTAAILCAAALTIPKAASVILGLTAVWALLSVRNAFYALIVTGFIRAGNYSHVSPGPMLLFAWAVILAACLRIILTVPPRYRRHPVLTHLCYFCLVVLLLAIHKSPLIEISISKLFVFLLGVSGILISSRYMNENKKFLHNGGFHKLLLLLLLSLTLFSIPALFIPGFGYAVNGTGFQGITNHPQLFGVVLAPLAGWAIGLWAEASRMSKHQSIFAQPWGLVLIGLALFLLVLSKSRTAVLALLLALSCCILIGFYMKQSWKNSLSAVFSRRNWPIFLVLAVATAVSVHPGTLLSSSVAFLQKDKSGSTDIMKLYEESRGKLMEFSWQNFLDNPLAGCGFGIPPNNTFCHIIRDPFFGLPISAPEEKGNSFLAILGETGIVGAIFFVFLLWTMTRRVLFHASLPNAILFFTALFVNFGEGVLFSLGGQGLIIWFYMSIAIVEGRAGR